MKYILMNKNTKVLSANYQPSLGVFTDIYDIYNIDFAPVILKNVYNKEKDLKVMDSTATAMCRDNHMPLLVFGIEDPENIVRAVKGEKIGTIVKWDTGDRS